ncbi:hypothetical protein [Sphingomonas sp.]|uniref:hypothetical protein n=1 Tax=Sphingomonas sp. TaxID=28214 RepID=UPI003B3B52AE
MTTPSDRRADAEAADAAMKRWLGPAFEVVAATYSARLQEIAASEPWETAKIAKLAVALKIAAEVRKQIEAVVADGAVAAQDIRYRKQIENIPHEKRKILGIGL